MLIEKVFMTVTAISLVLSGQLLVDIPGLDVPDFKDLGGLGQATAAV